MNNIKKIFIVLIITIFMPIIVNAGVISFNSPIKTSDNTYKFTLTVDNINLNYIKGNFSITNGQIIKITMSSSWINKTGTSNNFYFYHNGSSTGSYQVATIEVAMTGNSEYKVNNLEYKLNKCTTDNYGNYFGENGNIVSKAVYESTCLLSKDAKLKSITPSSGKLYPNFDPALELYSITVENNVSSINFNPVVNDSKSRVISGSSCSLKVGINNCNIVVRAESGATKTYQITVSRKNAYNNTLSSDASIRSLEVHGGGVLTKSFNPDIKEYDVKVKNDTKEMYFTFITNNNNQKYTSKSCSINEATKTCKLTITAEDGKTKNTYLFNVIHENNSNSNNNNSNNNNNNNNSSNKPSNNGNNNSNNNNNNNSNNSSNGNNTIDIDVDNNEVDKDNNNSTDSKPDNNEKNEVNNDSKENNEKEEEIVNIPIINKEIKKDNFMKIITVVDFLLGIAVGLIIVKICRRIKIIRGK